MADQDAARSRVLVTDGEQRAALAVVRSLGAAGHLCFVAAAVPGSLAGGSVHAAEEALVPDPLKAPAGYARAIAELVRRWRIAIVIPIAEPSMLALLDAREQLGGVMLPFPDAETFRRISDKELVLSVAHGLGISVPKQHVLNDPADAVPADLRFPVVLKPARTIGSASGERVQLTVMHAGSLADLGARRSSIPPAGYPILLQERIVGPGVGIFLLRAHGQTLAVFSHRRLREKPPSGGVSVYRESIAADPELVSKSEALLDFFGWESVAMIEFKLDGEGRPYLMEINGRFWGSLQLAIDAGVDFPALLVAVATGAEVSPVRDYRVSTRSRWLWGDIDQLLTRLRHSPEQLALPPGGPTRLRALLDFCHIGGRRDREEVFRLRDPRPFWRETRAWFRALRSG